jgi:hypothetical protein
MTSATDVTAFSSRYSILKFFECGDDAHVFQLAPYLREDQLSFEANCKQVQFCCIYWGAMGIVLDSPNWQFFSP